MSKSLTREQVPFLIEAMDKKHGLTDHLAEAAGSVSNEDGVKGEMSIPQPVEVNVQGTMTEEDYEKCSMIMAVCTNMVQQTITNAAIDAGVPINDALRSMDTWIIGFTAFPFPFFTFKDSQNDTYSKKEFNLNADPEVVDQILNIKNVAGLKDAVTGALKASGGDIAGYSDQERDFNYFGVITAYNETDISTRVIKFALHMKDTNAKALCITYSNTSLNTTYDTYQFVGDKYMMIKMQEAINEKLIEKMAERLLEFIDDFYQQQLDGFRDKVKAIVSSLQ